MPHTRSSAGNHINWPRSCHGSAVLIPLFSGLMIGLVIGIRFAANPSHGKNNLHSITVQSVRRRSRQTRPQARAAVLMGSGAEAPAG